MWYPTFFICELKDLDLFNSKGFLCVDTTVGDKLSDEYYYCYFAYQHGVLSYIGYGDRYRVNHCKNDSSSVEDFRKNKTSVKTYLIEKFNTKEEAKLFESHYINKIKPKQNKQFCKVDSYGLIKQKRFIPKNCKVSEIGSREFLISLLHYMKVDQWVISKQFNCGELELKSILSKEGCYKETLHAFEYLNEKGIICADKTVCNHFKIIFRSIFNQSEEIYMKISDF